MEPSTKAPASGSVSVADAICRSVSLEDKQYTVSTQSPNVHHIECGSLGMNILCGCCAQYYAFDVTVSDSQVRVVSTVPCGGFWGGVIGIAKNDAETKRVKQVLTRVFPGRQVT